MHVIFVYCKLEDTSIIYFNLCSISMHAIMFTADNANEEQEIYGNEQEQIHSRNSRRRRRRRRREKLNVSNYKNNEKHFKSA